MTSTTPAFSNELIRAMSNSPSQKTFQVAKSMEQTEHNSFEVIQEINKSCELLPYLSNRVSGNVSVSHEVPNEFINEITTELTTEQNSL
jgi:hypothetical protein